MGSKREIVVMAAASETVASRQTSHWPFGCLCHSPRLARINERLFQAEMIGAPAIAAGAASASPTPAGASAKPQAHDAGQPILFRNVAIFDGRSAELIRGQQVLVAGDTIVSIVPLDSQVEGARVIDAGGRTLMPGLIDAHWHAMLANLNELVAMTADVGYIYLAAAHEAEATLLRGFTTVRDTGGPSFALKRAIDEGLAKGPRIFPSGAMISQTGGHGDFRMRGEVPRHGTSSLSIAEQAGVAMIADGPDEVLRRVREQLMLGASQIKVVVGGGITSNYDPLDGTQFTSAEIKAAVDAAKDWGTYVCTHVYLPEGINRAIDCGVACIEHGQLTDEVTVKRMADTGTHWCLQPFLADEDANQHPAPQAHANQLWVAEGTARAFEWALKYKAKIGWGTDILFSPGKTVTQGKQLAKLARWMSNVDVLRLATSGNAEILGLSGKRAPYPKPLGVIEKGAYADMLLIDGNPLADISLIADPSKMVMIMKNGVIHKDAR